MTLGLRICSALVGDPSSVSALTSGGSQPLVTSAPGELTCVLASTGTHIQVHIAIHRHIQIHITQNQSLSISYGHCIKQNHKYLLDRGWEKKTQIDPES